MSDLAAGDCKTLPGTYEPMNYQSLMTWIKAVRILTLGLVVLIVSCLFTCSSIAINNLYGLCVLLQFLICSLTLICWHESRRKYLSFYRWIVFVSDRVKRGLPVWSTSRPRICSPRRSWWRRMKAFRWGDNHFYSTVPSALTPSNMT